MAYPYDSQNFEDTYYDPGLNAGTFSSQLQSLSNVVQEPQSSGLGSDSFFSQKRLTPNEIAARKQERLSAKNKNIEDDSDLEIVAKRAYNAVNNIWGGRDLNANKYGQEHSLDNKIFEDSGTTEEQSIQNRNELVNQYNTAKDDPSAAYRVYHLRLNDGLDEQGNPLYTYKTGIAETSAADRYRQQYISQGYDILDEKSFAGAEDWENKWHGNRANLTDRTYGTGFNEQGKKIKDIAQLDSGYTEVYNTDQFGFDDSKERLASNKYNSEMLMKAVDKEYEGRKSGINKAFNAGAIRALASTGDFILDVLTPGNNTLLDEAKQQENIDKLVGYDRRKSSAVLTESANDWQNGDYFSAAGRVLATPEIAAESVATMLEMAVGFGKFTKLGQLAGKLNAANAAGKTSEVAALTAQIAKNNSAAQQAMYKAASNAGFLAVVGEQTNNDLEERKANNGGIEPTLGEIASVTGLNFALLGLDRLAFDKITGIEGGKLSLKNAFSSADAVGKKKILLGIGEQATALTSAGLGEAAQEYVQTWGEILGTQLGTKKNDGEFSKIISSEENADEALKGMLGGFAGGVQFRAGADAISGTIGGLKYAKDKLSGNKTVDDSEYVVDANKKIDEFSKHIATFDSGDSKGLFAANNALKSIDESKISNKDVLKNIQDSRNLLLEKAESISRKAIYSGDEDAMRTLGSDQESLDLVTRKENFKSLLSFMNDSSDFDNSSVSNNIASIGKAFGLSEKDVSSISKEQSVLLRTKKTIDTVEQEVVSDKDKGYESYFSNLSSAIDSGKEDDINLYTNKINDFSASQEDKATKLSSAIDDVKKDINSIIDEAIKSGQVRTREEGLNFVIKSNKQVPVTYSEFSGNFNINHSDVAKNMLDENSKSGAILVLDKINNSVKSIKDLSSTYGIKLKKSDAKDIPDDVRESDIANKIKKQLGIIRKTRDIASKYNNVNIKDIDNDSDREAVVSFRNAQKFLTRIKKTESVSKDSKSSEVKEAPEVKNTVESKAVEPKVESLEETVGKPTISDKDNAILDNALKNYKEGKPTGLKELNTASKEYDKETRELVKAEILKVTKQIKDFSANESNKESNKESDKKPVKEFVKETVQKPKEKSDKTIEAKQEPVVAIYSKLGSSVFSKIDELLKAYESGSGKKIGGGYIEDSMVEDGMKVSFIDEDVKAGTFEKGIEQESLKDLLPVIHGNTIKSYRTAYNKYTKELNRSKSVISKINDMIRLVERVELDPYVSDAIFGSTVDIAELIANIKPSSEEFTPEMVSFNYSVNDNYEELIPHQTDMDIQEIVEQMDVFVTEEVFDFPEHVSSLQENFEEIKKEVSSSIKNDNIIADSKLNILRHNLDSFTATVDSFIDDINSLKAEKEILSAEMSKVSNEIRMVNGRIKKANDLLKRTTSKAKTQSVLGSISALLSDIIRRIYKLLDGFNIDKYRLVNKKIELSNKIRDINTNIEAIYSNKIAPFKEQIADIKNELEGTLYVDSIVGSKIEKNGKIVATNGSTIYAGVSKIKGQHVNPLNIVESNKISKNVLSSFDLNESPISVSVLNFSNSATEAISRILAAPTKDGAEKLRGQNGPARGLIFSKVEDEFVVNKNVATAIALAADEYISFMSSKLMFNTVEDISAMLGIEEFDLSPETIEFWKDKGKFKKIVAAELGTNILKNLSLKIRKDIDVETGLKLQMDLGHIALYYIEFKGYIEPLSEQVVTPEQFKVFGGRDILVEYSDGNIYESNAQNTTMVKLKKGVEIEKISAIFSTVEEDIGLESNVKGYVFTKPKDKVHTIRKNDVTSVPKESNDTLNVLSKEEYEINIDGVNELLNIGYDKVLELLGYTSDSDLKTLAYEDHESAVARNRELKTSVDNLFSLKNEIDSGKENKFYFNWFFSRNGRFMMDSVKINPQTDKLHRFFVTPKKFNTSISFDNAENMSVFKAAIAQSFGFAIDKESTKDINEFAEFVLEQDVNDLRKIFDNGDLKLGKYKLEAEHLSHTIQGIQSVTVYQNALEAGNKSFNTNLTVEFDAVTSGFILKLMQLPILGIDKTREWLKKGGVFTSNGNIYDDFSLSSVESMNDEVASGRVVDSYRTLASKMEEPVSVSEDNDPLSVWNILKDKKFLPSILDKIDINQDKVDAEPVYEYTVSKAGRALFKNPFMTFGYSAGMKSIRRHLGYNMIEDIPTKLLDKSEESNELIDILIQYSSKTRKEFRKELQEKSFEEIVLVIDEKKNKKFAGEYFRAIIDEAYGSQVEQTLSSEFSELIEANTIINNSFKMMFRAWKVKYDSAIQKAGGFGVVTREQEQQIIKDLIDVFPLIKAPLGEGSADGIAIVNSGTDTKYDYKYGAAQTALANGSSPKVQSMIRQFEEAINSGAVIPIHYIDGSAMTKVLAKGGIVGVHDAQLSSLTDAVNVVKDYNSTVYSISKDYSLVSSLLESMRRVGSSMTKKERDSIENILLGFGEKAVSYSFDDIGISLAELNSSVEAGREELFSRDMKIMHMSSIQGTEFSTSLYKSVDENRNIENYTEEDILLDSLGYGSPSSSSEYNTGVSEANKVLDAVDNKHVDNSGTEYVLVEADVKRINDMIDKNKKECES